MSNDKLVKLFSLNLGTKGVGKNERPCPMGGSAHASNVSHTSSGVEKQSNSFLGWGSAKTSTNDSCTSIKSEQLNPYKRVNSLSEYVYRFKKLAPEGGTTRGGSNIFRKYNTNRRKTSSSDLRDRSSVHHVASHVARHIADHIAGHIAGHIAHHIVGNYKTFKSHMSIDTSPLCSYLNTIGRLETKVRNEGTAILSRVGGTLLQSRDPPLGKTGREMTNLGKLRKQIRK
ncbi:hypothetical protein PCYB_052340 [Plasmodium cynomolgi strain B]|uniref:Uncharacterized protein n=1 Tax=Plasmodium cynomolgi (strain B) TaxID=1120755 RepID=K6UCP6_PLACD|nr:hypothetical protein PCYB_052340 [Plasmodium cynomolgi strain B]GAB65216.1 hypothetical protein PCYB_052340 [Plasmodium cynomolgi strain B]